ncbi:MAG: isochorismate synthase [Halobacteria archaeon]|nr:isochorismate synthase [Halobacteria archaeon]
MDTLDCDGEDSIHCETSESRLVSRSVEVEAEDSQAALDAFLGSASETQTVFFWKERGTESVLAGKGEAVSVSVPSVSVSDPDSDPDPGDEESGRFGKVRDSVDAVFSDDADTDTTPEDAARPRLFGGFSFHDSHVAEGVWRDFPDARFVLPRYQLSSDEGSYFVTVNAYGDADADTDADTDTDTDGVDPVSVEAEAEDLRESLVAQSDPSEIASEEQTQIRRIQRGTSLPDWRRQVGDALERIESGSLEKVVLSQFLDVELDSEIDPVNRALRLSENFPDCYTFVFSPEGDTGFFGAPPERLVSVEGREVETEAIAGSIGRGETAEEDRRLGDKLRNSQKDLHEHAIVADSVVEQLSPLSGSDSGSASDSDSDSDSDSVETDEMELLKLGNVQHLRTPVRARLDDASTDVLTVAEALHPTPAVGGLPPDEALCTIRETERFDRGWYAAPVGWIDSKGDGCFAVGLRSAVTDGDTAKLFAGAGIVRDSDPDEEWEEVQLKYEPVLDLFRGEDTDTS